jgi:hypothetical protein
MIKHAPILPLVLPHPARVSSPSLTARGGQAWAVVATLKPLTNGEFGIPMQSLSQALQLQRILLQPA